MHIQYIKRSFVIDVIFFFSDNHKIKMNSSNASICYNSFVCTLARCTPLMCYFMLALIHQCKIKDLAFLFNRKKKCFLSSITCLLVIYMYKHVFILFTEIFAITGISRSEFGVIFLVCVTLSAFPEQGLTGEEFASTFYDGVQLFRSLWASCF